MTSPGIAGSRLDRQRLLDTYSPALTERQREALRLHLEEDWSVTELAQALGTSRAAAHDLLRRGLERMEEMEAELGVCRKLAAAERLRRILGRRVTALETELARRGGRA